MADATGLTTKEQEMADRFYMEHGPCCAGCDWWHRHSSLIGECRKSAPVSADERYSIVRMEWNTFRLRDADAGHILTNREHHCGDFKDGFDWPTLPPAYLRRIRWAGRNAGVDSSRATERLEPHSPPGLHLASNFYGFLRRHAHSLKDPTRGAVEQAAELIDLQRREIERLGRELENHSGVPASRHQTLGPTTTDTTGENP